MPDSRLLSMDVGPRSAGELVDAGTRVWVRATGRRVDVGSEAWLSGPTGDRDRIGDAWLDREITRLGGRSSADGSAAGLLPTMTVLDGPAFDAAALDPRVRSFYERTSDWRLEVWAQWCSAAWPFGWLIARVFAQRLEQLALPLRPLEVAHGMSSQVQTVLGPDERPVGTLWHRRLRATGRTVFSGWYGVVTPPAETGPCVRVVFPLPRGRLVVLLRPQVGPAGSLVLSSGRGPWGSAGAYLVVDPPGRRRAWARRIPVHERFSVHVDAEGVLRTDHAIDLGRLPVLRLHYRLDRIG